MDSAALMSAILPVKIKVASAVPSPVIITRLVVWAKVSVPFETLKVTSIFVAAPASISAIWIWLPLAELNTNDTFLLVDCAPGTVFSGASLTPATTISKVSVTVPPLPSLAITSIDTVPTKSLVGVPLNVRVPALKLNHAGNAPPPASCAL